MKVSAAKFKILEKSTGTLCCIIAVRAKDGEEFDARQVAEAYVKDGEHPPHKEVQIMAFGDDMIEFGESEDVRIIEYSQH